jgi:hypothetical protein
MGIAQVRTISPIIITLLITILFQSIFTDGYQNGGITFLENHDINIQTLSSKVFTVDCIEDDILYGEFVVTSDGDLYPGDQRKYDLWVGWGNGVDFFIFNQANYDTWVLGEEAVSKFEKKDTISLTWSVTVDEAGIWYVVYVNDSPTYIKTVEGSIQHSSAIDYLLISIEILGGVFVFTILIFLLRYKTKKH